MSGRISYGKNTPQSFRESLIFDQQCPYRIRYKEFPNDDLAPLHYADTIELGIYHNVEGTVVMDNCRVTLAGNGIYFIPPGTVHSTCMRKGTGSLYLLHISPDAVREYLGLEALVAISGKRMEGFCEETLFSPALSCIQEMIQKDDMPVSRFRALMELWELCVCALPEGETGKDSWEHSEKKPLLRQILRWTEANFTQPIRLEQAAAAVGFSPNYFCAWFKAGTGWTYKQYLIHLRINHACRLLIETGSLAVACYQSGFQDMGYFIQTFKRIQGCTPKAYLRNSGSSPV